MSISCRATRICSFRCAHKYCLRSSLGPSHWSNNRCSSRGSQIIAERCFLIASARRPPRRRRSRLCFLPEPLCCGIWMGMNHSSSWRPWGRACLSRLWLLGPALRWARFWTGSVSSLVRSAIVPARARPVPAHHAQDCSGSRRRSLPLCQFRPFR
jgi:hypothetical protein